MNVALPVHAHARIFNLDNRRVVQLRARLETDLPADAPEFDVLRRT